MGLTKNCSVMNQKRISKLTMLELKRNGQITIKRIVCQKHVVGAIYDEKENEKDRGRKMSPETE